MGNCNFKKDTEEDTTQEGSARQYYQKSYSRVSTLSAKEASAGSGG